MENPVKNQNSPVVGGASGITLATQDVDNVVKKIKDDVEENIGKVILDSEEVFNTAVSKIGIPGHGV